MDLNGRSVRYTFGSSAGTMCLLTASQIFSLGVSPRSEWMYGYTSVNGEPYLSTVAVPDPNNANSTSSHPILPDAAGRVNQLTDASGNQRIFIYGVGQTTVIVKGPDGKVASQWTVLFDATGRTTGFIDALNHKGSIFFDDPANPDSPTRYVNRNGQEWRSTYDPFGNTLTEIDSRGLITEYTYDYSIRPTGLVTKIQVGSKTPVFLHYYPTGLVQSIDTPKPGTVGANQWVTTSFTYTALGNLLTVTGPAANNTGVPITATLNYIFDPADGTRSNEQLGQPLAVTDPLGHSSHTRWDTRGNLIADIDALGNRTDYAFNDARQLSQITFPATGEQGSYRARILNAFDYVGGPLTALYVFNEASVAERQYFYTFGKDGPATGQSGSALSMKWQYDGDNRLSKSVDGRNNAVSLNYGVVGNLLSQVYPTGDTDSIPELDADGNPLTDREGNGALIHYIRAEDDSRITDILYVDATAGVTTPNVHFVHDIYSRIIHMQDGTGSTDWTYDDLNNITSVTTTYAGLAPKTISYTFHPDGNRASMTTPTG